MKDNSIRKFVSLVLASCCGLITAAQKLPFQNYSVEKGLIQSQVLSITQDNQHHIWVGTYSGLDRFDGTRFWHFNKSDGLNSNSITALHTALDGKIWMATFKGISSYDGRRFTNYAVEGDAATFNFSALRSDSSGGIWVFQAAGGLYYLNGGKFVKAPLPYPGAIPTCFHEAGNGMLQVSFHQSGIFEFSSGAWKKQHNTPAMEPKEAIIFSAAHAGELLFVTNKKRFLKYREGKLLKQAIIKAGTINSVCIDGDNNIWIGTVNGAHLVGGNDFRELYRCDAAKGLTDNFISDIYADKQGNVWIGSDGEGLFSFTTPDFLKHDKSTGLSGNLVMGLCREGNTMLIATREGGLDRYDLASMKSEPIDYSAISKNGINCIARGKDGIYLFTLDNKLIRYNKKGAYQVKTAHHGDFFVNTITPINDSIWLSTDEGAYVLYKDSLRKMPGINDITSGILMLSNNEMLFGTINGLYHYRKGRLPGKVANPYLAAADVLCLREYKGYILIGTADDGLIVWDRVRNEVYKCNNKQGLLDNQVFGIFIDSRQQVWVGTGTGVQIVTFREDNGSFRVTRFSRASGFQSSETNLNAFEQDANGAVWIGTTKGAFIYTQRETAYARRSPFVVIQQVDAQEMRYDSAAVRPWQNYPSFARLVYKNNSISFTVKGVLLSDPANVLYSTQLTHYDKQFSEPSAQNYFNYKNLEPGNYTFKVRAFTKDGTLSENTAEFSFYISTPFHKSTGFYLVLTVGLILTGVMIQLLITRFKQIRKQELEKVKLGEQEKIRKQTAEDFHDELGNKLTRISLLTDILEKKLELKGVEADNDIIHQIRENVTGLYSGTKEVIWSLTPGSNKLRDIFKHIQEFGNELFNNSAIDFKCTAAINAISNNITLPVEYSRNLSMISKEILNNMLRHSGCTSASVELTVQGDEVLIAFSDNGKGMDITTVKPGNGLKNIRQRAARLNAELRVHSVKENGTRILLQFKIPLNEG